MSAWVRVRAPEHHIPVFNIWLRYHFNFIMLAWGKTCNTQTHIHTNALIIHIDTLTHTQADCERKREKATQAWSKHTPKATLPHELHPNEDKFSTFALTLLDKLPNKIYTYTIHHTNTNKNTNTHRYIVIVCEACHSVRGTSSHKHQTLYAFLIAYGARCSGTNKA